MPLSRRYFLHASVAGGTAAVCGCAPALRDLPITALPAAMLEVQRLVQAPQLHTRTAWGWATTMAHLAQSIEYSITGYPQMQSPLFQKTLGRPALALFAWRGAMRHDLSAPIPGSPPLPPAPPLAWAHQRLHHACLQFLQWRGPLQPHFAYGALSHAEYEQAHAMHLANHMAAFDVAPVPPPTHPHG